MEFECILIGIDIACDEHVCGIGWCLASLFVIEEVCILDDLVSTSHEVVVRKVSYSGFLYLAALFAVPVGSLGEMMEEFGSLKRELSE